MLRESLVLAILRSKDSFELFGICLVSLLSGVKFSVVKPNLIDLALYSKLEKMKVL